MISIKNPYDTRGVGCPGAAVGSTISQTLFLPVDLRGWTEHEGLKANAHSVLVHSFGVVGY